MVDLNELAVRCEAATGPDSGLDVSIWLAVKADENAIRDYNQGRAISEAEAQFRADYMMDGLRYTASLDAALTLVPDEMRWVGGVGDDGLGIAILAEPKAREPHGTCEAAATPALALCAASLRARRLTGEQVIGQGEKA